MLQQILVVQKKIVRIAFELPYRSRVVRKFENGKISTEIESYLDDLLKSRRPSLSQIQNNFEIPDAGSQREDFRSRKKNICIYTAENGVSVFLAISLR